MRDVPVPVRLGLVETQAAKHMARFGYYPEAYMRMVAMYCDGIVPQRVRELAQVLKVQRSWAVSEADQNPHPGMTRVHFGPHSFLVPTTEVTGDRTT